MFALYLESQLWQKWAPMLLLDDDSAAARAQGFSPVAKAEVREAAKSKIVATGKLAPSLRPFSTISQP